MTADFDYFGVDAVTLLGFSLGGDLVLRAAAYEPRVRWVIADDILTDLLAVQLRQFRPIARLALRTLRAWGGRACMTPAAPYDALVVAAHPDDAEVQLGGTIALLTDAGRHVLLVDLVTGEPTEFAEPGVRARQAAQAAAILGADRIILPYQDRLLRDTQELRPAVARLIRAHRPATVYATTGAAIHPDHVAACDIARAAVFLARLGQWERVPLLMSAVVRTR